MLRFTLCRKLTVLKFLAYGYLSWTIEDTHGTRIDGICSNSDSIYSMCQISYSYLLPESPDDQHDRHGI